MPEKTLNHRNTLKRFAPFFMVAAVALAAVVIMNPLRDFLGGDDSWSFARMVQYTLATGKYRMDPFTVVNLPVLIYLSAGAAKLFGYSLVLLRCITLAFLGLAIGSFYLLLREFGHSRALAALFSLVLLSSPLVLVLSFAFMSDIPFLAWMLLALFLYVRGFRQDSTRLMFLGSLAAGCAIGTRQFAMAIVGGLIASWLFSKDRLRPRLMLVGLAVPLLAAVIQVYVGIRFPSATGAQSMLGVRQFYRLPLHVIIEEYFWRCSIITQYLGIALLPLLPVAFAVPRSFWKQRVGRIPVWTLGFLTCAAIVVALSLSSQTARPATQHRGLWEPLELYWLFPVNFGQLRPLMRFLDTFGILGGAALVVLALYRLRPRTSLRSIRPETLLLLGTAASLFFLHLPFNHLNDTYLVGFLPFLLLFVADAMRPLDQRPNLLRAATAFSVFIILTMSLWLRGEYARLEAGWRSADGLYDAGVQPINMVAPYDWYEYHGAFNEWIAQDPSINFFKFMSRGWDSAQFAVQIAPSPLAPPGWRLLSVRDYRNTTFKKRYVLTLERDPIR
jgi:4-amino-4-deoxy-L-arabinose transferase-like glycosyltransferase